MEIFLGGLLQWGICFWIGSGGVNAVFIFAARAAIPELMRPLGESNLEEPEAPPKAVVIREERKY